MSWLCAITSIDVDPHDPNVPLVPPDFFAYDLLEEMIGARFTTRERADLQHSMDSVARHIDAINTNLEATTRNMTEFTRQLREDPSVVIRGRGRPERETGWVVVVVDEPPES